MTDNYEWVGPTKAAEGMHPDLEWLARNVSEWKPGYDYLAKRIDSEGSVFETKESANYEQHNDYYGRRFTFEQWLQARKDLGLIMSDEEEEIPAQEWSNDDTIPTSIKQLRYQDAKGEDWIDEFARTASVDEFRGAMRFTIGKYNRRAGKKDELIKEIEKMRDYCDRWIDYERTL